MIEDKDLGLKVAEDKQEDFWSKLKTRTEESIDQAGYEIEIQEEVLKLCIKKLS